MNASRRRARALALARTFELATCQAHARAHQDGLYPAQWAALRYFKNANGDHRTSIGLARYQGMAFGPVARTVRTLIQRGLLRKAGSAGRGRAELVELTPAGEATLARDPMSAVACAIESLGDGQQDTLAEALENILGALR